MKQFHFCLGVLVLCTYIYLWLHFNELFPELMQLLHAVFCKAGRAGRGRASFVVLLSLPLFSAACFMFPKFFENNFSPRTSPLNEPVLTAGAWYIIGYFSLVFSMFLFL